MLVNATELFIILHKTIIKLIRIAKCFFQVKILSNVYTCWTIFATGWYIVSDLKTSKQFPNTYVLV